jgi:hypothetical protein
VSLHRLSIYPRRLYRRPNTSLLPGGSGTEPRAVRTQWPTVLRHPAVQAGFSACRARGLTWYGAAASTPAIASCPRNRFTRGGIVQVPSATSSASMSTGPVIGQPISRAGTDERPVRVLDQFDPWRREFS